MNTALRLLLLSALIACNLAATADNQSTQAGTNYVKVKHPEWAKNASIYQINTRQFTPEGTLKAAQKELPRLKKLGMDIIWLMPIHPIGELNRKGTLGSPYSVKDYKAVNPEFGTFQDLKNFVAAAHELGMYVILDWVANHSAWDNVWIKDNAHWYERDHEGNYRPTPWWDWSDIIELDYSQKGMRAAMIDAMSYWVREADIDGYRADVAGFVPLDFWQDVRQALDEIKPVFMLAEWESRDLHAKAFDMTYAWTWHEAIHHVTNHPGNLGKLFVYYSWNESAYPKDSYRMTYITNHDVNAWEGTISERFGDAAEMVLALSYVGEGMPLIYNGVEAGMKQRLAFFEKDPIQWAEHPFTDLIQRFNELLKENTALWHGRHGATMIRVWNDNPDRVFSFVRQNENNKVLVVMNMSDKAEQVVLTDNLHKGNYRDFSNGKQVNFSGDTAFKLKPWEYRIFIAK